MQDYIVERILTVADYTIAHKATVRATAKQFGISKSTVHKDLRDRLPEINPALSKEINAILDFNKAQRHLRGGLATKRKYQERQLRS